MVRDVAMSSPTPLKTYRVRNRPRYVDDNLRCSFLIRDFDFSEQLDNKISERQETAARIEEQEQQILSVSAKK